MVETIISSSASRRNRRSPGDGPLQETHDNLQRAPPTMRKAHHRPNSQRRLPVGRIMVALCFLAVYAVVYHRLGDIEDRYHENAYQQQQIQQQQQQYQQQQIRQHSPQRMEASRPSQRPNRTLAHYLGAAGAPRIANSPQNVSISLQEAKRGREPILSILEDAGIDQFDAHDVLRLPLWSSVSQLYYHPDHRKHVHRDIPKETDPNHSHRAGPIILGLETCQEFRSRVPVKDRFLGVAGNFNSGTTAFGISLQKNCRFAEQRSQSNFVIRKRKSIFASNVHGMLSQVPWAKHKMGDYRRNHTILPPEMDPIHPQRVLPIVVVRDPFYWMQSMCKEGYGVRWDHDSQHHCPNLVPNDFDKERYASQQQQPQSIPVWMGANPTVGPKWPSLIHYWNAWYESYYNNSNTNSNDSSHWPRLMIRFEDTLFYPKQVMEKVCHCGGGKLRSELAVSGSSNHPLELQWEYDYSLEEAKPDHKHQGKNNFVTAMMEYGSNANRLRNMTQDDVDFAIRALNPTLMRAFGYSYPSTTISNNAQASKGRQ